MLCNPDEQYLAIISHIFIRTIPILVFDQMNSTVKYENSIQTIVKMKSNLLWAKSIVNVSKSQIIHKPYYFIISKSLSYLNDIWTFFLDNFVKKTLKTFYTNFVYEKS